jgi:pectate lyase
VHPYSEDLLLSTKDILTTTFNYSNSDITFLGINRRENVNNSLLLEALKNNFLKNILLTMQYQCAQKYFEKIQGCLEDGGQYLRLFYEIRYAELQGCL